MVSKYPKSWVTLWDGRCRIQVVLLVPGLWLNSAWGEPSPLSPVVVARAADVVQGPGPSMHPMGRRCLEPMGESDPTHPSHVRTNFYNQYGCKIPLREGKSNFGYQHIVKRGLEKLAQGKPDNHEVTPYA